MKSSKVSIKTRSTPASLSFKGQATKHTTVKWSIRTVAMIIFHCVCNKLKQILRYNTEFPRYETELFHSVSTALK